MRERGGKGTSWNMSMKTSGLLAACVVALGLATPAGANESGPKHEDTPNRYEWSFSGVGGRYDAAQLKRGFKVYKEVCSTCHSIKLLAFRNLGEPGGPTFTEAEVAALAATYKIKDGPNEQGDMFERPGRPSDRFPPPFPSEQAARAALGGAYPPDMSVLAKARGYSRGFPSFLLDALPGFAYQEQGVDYITSLLNGYSDPPEGFNLPQGQYYNRFMSGRRIGMPPPLADGAVAYDDKTPQTVEQYAKDVSAFMMWAAEPHLDDRKKVGAGVLGFMFVFCGLLFFTKRRIWKDVAH